MRRFILAVVCYLTVITSVAQAQSPSSGIKPIHVPAGTVLTFYLQTRLNPVGGNALDLLPKGTILSVKILNSIDSDVNRDGSEFRGLVVSPLVSRDEVVIHTDAEVRGLFALLRSRNHPDGFRYELLITGISDGGKTFQLTASLNPSFLDGGSQPTSKTSSSSTAPTTANDGSSSAMHK